MQRVVLGIILMVSIFTNGTIANNNIDQKAYQQDFIRFHVLANSDTPEDQALKYQVKDVLVQEMESKFLNSQNIDETRNILLSNLAEIERKGQETVSQLGSNYEVKALYGRFSFPTKYYGRDFSLPAGEYEAVRIIIGEGNGANWWCVLFPPMCFVNTDTSAHGAETHSTVDQEDDKTKLRISFKILEWFEASFPTLAKIFH